MKSSDELRLGKSIISAQERLRLCLCRIGKAADWHLAKASKVVEKPKLLNRVVPHLEGEDAKKYLAQLPGWIEQTRQQDVKCNEVWNNGRADYDVQEKHLIAMLLRYDFSLRSYERLARQPSEVIAENGKRKKGAKSTDNGAPARMTPEDLANFQERIQNDLDLIDKARAELMAAHESLIEKLAQTSDAPIKEATQYARHGLLKAAENFDVRRGHRFSAYAQKWIKAAIKEKMKCDE